ncbi:MAG: hypothetical protein ABII20_00415 [Candidatus Omnitrophota bacterium]|nr:hypothetical protein [Candidatus Omnitrophota bacterium]MBU2528490.1 hypothetical protein [bacterium]MBU3930802.1 hypothetical protein [bacterium]MBU4122413.1 hypothetical protein [bacterium]
MRGKFNIRTVLIVFLLSIVFILNLTKISDPDFFWHLKTGEIIAASGAPAQDTYSWTHGGGKWLDHEWLSQLIFHAVFKTAGFAGIILLKAAFITGAFFMVFLTCLKLSSSFEISVFVSALGAAASSLTYSARPWIFSFFLLAALILILYGGKSRHIRAVPFLFVLWINLHGMFIIGAVVLAVFASEETIRLRKVSSLGYVALIAAAALLLNPYGIRAALHPFKYLYGSTHTHMSYIMEWMSPDFHSIHGKALIIFAAATLLSFIFSPEKPAARDMFLYFSFLAGALYSARNIPLFIIVTSPAASRHMALWLEAFLKRVSDKTSQGVIKSKPLGALNYFLVALAAVLIVMTFNKNFRGGYLQDNELPGKAAEEIVTLKPSRLLHPYHWGGYLIYSGIKVFIDGRADFYPGGFLEDFFQSTELMKDPREFLEKNNFDFILWEKNAPLSFYLGNSEDWKLLRSDEISVIYKRKKRQGI